MKFVRFGAPGAEKPGLIDEQGYFRDLSGEIEDIAGNLLTTDFEKVRKISLERLPLLPDTVRLGPPVGGIGKIVGVGLNYQDHARECSFPIPKEPTLFLKATSLLAGPNDDVRIPENASQLDWEVELAVVIGRGGVNIPASSAPEHIAGFCLAIDFSERAFQFDRGGQGFKGKSADTFGPLGPWLVMADAIDLGALRLTLSVNGETRQNGAVSDMIFSVPKLVSYVSEFMSLHPCDVIITGTPAGVSMATKNYLKPADVLVAFGSGLGKQRHVIRTA